MKREAKVVGRTTTYLASHPPRGKGDTVARFHTKGRKGAAR